MKWRGACGGFGPLGSRPVSASVAVKRAPAWCVKLANAFYTERLSFVTGTKEPAERLNDLPKATQCGQCDAGCEEKCRSTGVTCPNPPVSISAPSQPHRPKTVQAMSEQGACFVNGSRHSLSVPHPSLSPTPFLELHMMTPVPHHRTATSSQRGTMCIYMHWRITLTNRVCVWGTGFQTGVQSHLRVLFTGADVQAPTLEILTHTVWPAGVGGGAGILHKYSQVF